jgi:hypothetical protein
MLMKKSNGTIGKRSHDHPVCSPVPQQLRHRVIFKWYLGLLKDDFQLHVSLPISRFYVT